MGDRRKIILRIIIDLVLLLLISIAPWWLVIILSLLLAFYFKFYIEAPIFALILDILYSDHSFLLGADFWTLMVLVIFVGIQALKEKMILY